MPTDNYDASLVASRARARTLYNFNANLLAARVANANVVGTEQPTFQVLDVVTQRQQGGCMCAASTTIIPYYRRNTPGASSGASSS
jgi:hypothetical protein